MLEFMHLNINGSLFLVVQLPALISLHFHFGILIMIIIQAFLTGQVFNSAIGKVLMQNNIKVQILNAMLLLIAILNQQLLMKFIVMKIKMKIIIKNLNIKKMNIKILNIMKMNSI